MKYQTEGITNLALFCFCKNTFPKSMRTPLLYALDHNASFFYGETSSNTQLSALSFNGLCNVTHGKENEKVSSQFGVQQYVVPN